MDLLNQNNITIDNQEINKESLIRTFEILYREGMISKGELLHAIAIVNERYRS